MTAGGQPLAKPLGLAELVAIALGGMVGGGIFTILGISVDMIGAYTPLAILIGGLLATLAAYSYIKLGTYYLDEGATYSFFKRTFPGSPFAASLIGWWVIFGYISTLALYAYTFSAYALSDTALGGNEAARKLVAGMVIALFTSINLWSVKGMGRIEDAMVYTKLFFLLLISLVLLGHGEASLPVLLSRESFHPGDVLIVAALTFVAYEGFQLVINAVNDMPAPARQIPRAIYTAIALAVLIYVVMALAAIMAIPFPDIIANKEHALAAGAGDVMGAWGTRIVIAGALLATSSAISGTLFGASRQLAVIASDGYFPAPLSRRRHGIPGPAIIAMAACAFGLILAGSLEVILEFGSVTFLLVSMLMAYANFRMRRQTRSSPLLAMTALLSLAAGTLLIFGYELTHQPEQLAFIAVLYLLLTGFAWIFARHARPAPQA